MKKGTVFRRLSAALSLAAMAVLTSGCAEQFIVLDPKGPIGAQQRDLIVISTLLCLVVILPVLIMTAVIVWRYRDKPGNKAKYAPKWEHNTKLEVVWWTIPILVIIALGVITVKATYELEPSKPIESEAETLTIQVTSLDWKWLFKYPEQGIATVNYIEFPEDVPIRFELTSDAPMNSFWIPQLGGQIYTMSGMAMKLHLQADEAGEYFGSGANFSGKDFAQMRFTAKATSQEEFDAWVAEVKESAPALTMDGYKQLAQPGTSDVQYFSGFPEGLFDQIVTKYAHSHSHGLSTRETEMREPTGHGSSHDGLDGAHGGHGSSHGEKEGTHGGHNERAEPHDASHDAAEAAAVAAPDGPNVEQSTAAADEAGAGHGAGHHGSHE